MENATVTRFAHLPVLCREVVDALLPGPTTVIVDATLGGGGHTEALLQASAPTGKVIGIDQDADAIAAASERLSAFGERVTIRRGNFSDIADILADVGLVDGFLLDLGVSSYQLDEGSRGFSLKRDGQLDMRMDQRQTETAGDLIGRLRREDLAKLLKEYGDVKFAGRIARILKEAVSQGVDSTVELARRIASIVPKQKKRGKIHPATTVFQALRIAINRELESLDRFLVDFPNWLKPGGRVVIMSYHSLEDRRVKNGFRDLARGPRGPIEFYPDEPHEATLRILTKKPIVPSEAERLANPRSRSAKLRVAERL